MKKEYDKLCLKFLFQANEIARLIRQYITIDQRMKGGEKQTHSDGDGAYDDDEVKQEDHNVEDKVKNIKYPCEAVVLKLKLI